MSARHPAQASTKLERTTRTSDLGDLKSGSTTTERGTHA